MWDWVRSPVAGRGLLNEIFGKAGYLLVESQLMRTVFVTSVVTTTVIVDMSVVKTIAGGSLQADHQHCSSQLKGLQTHVVVAVVVAVNVTTFVDMTNTAPTHLTADWYLGGENTNLPFLIVNPVLPERAWSDTSATLLWIKLRLYAGLSVESGNDDIIGMKPEVVPMVVADDKTVVRCVFEETDVSVTTLLRR